MIAILGWGSLIWKPDGLSYEGSWETDGPVLSLEFSKIADNKRLTVVLDLENGVNCPTLWARSSCTHLEDAIEDLRQREGTTIDKIGYIDLEQNRSSIAEYPEQTNIDRIVREWCESKEISAAIWTAIPPNFPEKLGVPFSIESAVRYYESLSPADQDSVMEYICRTPPEIDTPLRRRMQHQTARI
ncbi:hypothetical protein [Leptolyngbya ohadii]|uniref:hypothetical protein n=1 Tax=Leptolyngbya ohadii TaxID=1962290 RepID=UPI000B59CD4D|nr:hypothetical protein [Leptolyngbya ohadii]